MLNSIYAHCVDTCRDCIQACEAALQLMPAPAAPGETAHCADLCRSAIRLCSLVIEELELRSVFSVQVCALCAVICRACADECELREGPLWRESAAACRRAALECHAIAKLPRGAGTGRLAVRMGAGR